MSARFRSHLTTGLTLQIRVNRSPEQMDFSIEDATGAVMVTATATAPRDSELPANAPDSTSPSFLATLSGIDPEPSSDPSPTTKLKPNYQSLLGQSLASMAVSFDAERDLYFVPELRDGALWQKRGWAHPSWLASCTNALVRRTIDFDSPQQWLHAGLSYEHLSPIESGDTVILRGVVEHLFDGGQRQFATCAIQAMVGGRHVASIKNTFAYASIEP